MSPKITNQTNQNIKMDFRGADLKDATIIIGIFEGVTTTREEGVANAVGVSNEPEATSTTGVFHLRQIIDTFLSGTKIFIKWIGKVFKTRVVETSIGEYIVSNKENIVKYFGDTIHKLL